MEITRRHFHTEEYLMEKLNYQHLLGHKYYKHTGLVYSVLEKSGDRSGNRK